MLFLQELMTDNPGINALLGANKCHWATNYLIGMYYTKAEDSYSQFQHEKLQLHISVGSPFPHP